MAPAATRVAYPAPLSLAQKKLWTSSHRLARRLGVVNDRQKAICCVSLRCDYEKSRCANRLTAHYTEYTDKAKLRKAPSILRTENKLRQQGAGRQDRDLGEDCLERSGGNQQRGGERDDRKTGRAAAGMTHSSILMTETFQKSAGPARILRGHRTSRARTTGDV
eukprot:6198734-Pleurochrysis_carterae.AAC.3